MNDNYGDEFQEFSKMSRKNISRRPRHWDEQPPLYKSYKNAFQIPLIPQHDFNEIKSFLNLARTRKSIRSFKYLPLSKQEISYLLWVSTGVQRQDYQFEFRTVPSAGGLYPIETYVICNIEGFLPKGIFHYNIQNHILEQLKQGDFSESIAKAGLHQKMLAEASIVFIWTAVVQRSKWKYEQRAYRYIYLDAGHIGGMLALAAVDLGLGSCQIGAFFDDEINYLLDLDGMEETTIYLSVVGNPNK